MATSVEVKLSGSRVKLEEGSMLFCPSHGPGKVIAIETRECLGSVLTFCRMEFENNEINVLIPLEKMKSMGIRTIISKESAKKILNSVLNKSARSTKGTWTKRIQEIEAKLYSGNTMFIAEVVRDLFAGMKDPNKSYGERVLFDKAFRRLVLELSMALGYTIEETNKIVLDILNLNYKASHDSDIVLEESDDVGDFSDEDVDYDLDEDTKLKKSA